MCTFTITCDVERHGHCLYLEYTTKRCIDLRKAGLKSHDDIPLNIVVSAVKTVFELGLCSCVGAVASES